jgi:predicted porin
MGDINFGAAYTAKEADVQTVTYDNSATHVTAGGSYNYGAGKVSVGYAKKATKTTVNDNTITDMFAGASYNMSDKAALTVAYYSRATNSGAANAADSTATTTMLQATYGLSKKTTLYVEADRNVTNAGGGATDVLMNGISAGLDVKF